MPLRKKFSCQFPDCSNGYYWCKDGLEKVQNKHFYRFPTNPTVNVQWKKICGINLTENCRNKYVCEDHFKEKDFVNFTKYALNPFVVPSQLQNDLNLIPVEVATSSQNDLEITNYCQPLHSVNSLASNNTNSTFTVSEVTVNHVSNTFFDIASKDVSVNLNVEQSLDTHIESVNNNNSNISCTINSNNFCKQYCICEDANCQRDNSDDDIIVTDNLTEHNKITSTQTKKDWFFNRSRNIFKGNDTD